MCNQSINKFIVQIQLIAITVVGYEFVRYGHCRSGDF